MTASAQTKRNKRNRLAGVGLLLLAFTGQAVLAIDHPIPAAGPWRAWLESPGGELPFGLWFSRHDKEHRAQIVNGAEYIAVPTVTVEHGTVTLDIDYYDSVITARLDEEGHRLDGEWSKTGKKGAVTKMAFHARAGAAPRFPLDEKSLRSAARKTITGRWAVKFSGSDQPAVGLFDADDRGRVTGTFLTPTGDYRFLAGGMNGNKLKLSGFDGAHAFLFHATLSDDRTLSGDFWSRDTWHETWTAKRDADIRLPDAFTLTKWTGNATLSDLVFADLSGKPRALSDPAFAGRARIIEIFGSWCPNCHDASELLVELDRRYRSRGLSIVAVAFELTGDTQRDTAQLKKYIKRHAIEFPVLLAGVADKAEVAAALPVVDRFRAYPTTIFLDHTGKVRAIHTGFSGPATGEAHVELRKRFESLIESMLTETSPLPKAKPDGS